MGLNFDTAKAIVEAAHAAWNKRNIEGVLDQYTEDLVYTSNASGPGGHSLIVLGKSGLRAMLAPVLPVFDSMTSVESFAFADDVARVRVASFALHKASGLELSGTYRQIVHFRTTRCGSCRNSTMLRCSTLFGGWLRAKPLDR